MICRIRVSRSQVTAPRVLAMMTPEGGMISKSLEDMWPYLPPDEVAENMIAERRRAASDPARGVS